MWHKDGFLMMKLPYPFEVVIGQVRLCMFFLKKAHIGKRIPDQYFWPEEMIGKNVSKGIFPFSF